MRIRRFVAWKLRRRKGRGCNLRLIFERVREASLWTGNELQLRGSEGMKRRDGPMRCDRKAFREIKGSMVTSR